MSKSRLASGFLIVGCGLLSGGCGGGSGGASGGDVIKSGDSVTLFEVQAQVFSPRCALSGCHVGSTAPMGLDLSAGASAGNLVGVASAEIPELLRVEPFNAADSYLYMKLTADPRILGDPMPLSGGPLSTAELALIERWVDEGAL